VKHDNTFTTGHLRGREELNVTGEPGIARLWSTPIAVTPTMSFMLQFEHLNVDFDGALNGLHPRAFTKAFNTSVQPL